MVHKFYSYLFIYVMTYTVWALGLGSTPLLLIDYFIIQHNTVCIEQRVFWWAHCRHTRIFITILTLICLPENCFGMTRQAQLIWQVSVAIILLTSDTRWSDELVENLKLNRKPYFGGNSRQWNIFIFFPRNQNIKTLQKTNADFPRIERFHCVQCPNRHKSF